MQDLHGSMSNHPGKRVGQTGGLAFICGSAYETGATISLSRID